MDKLKKYCYLYIPVLLGISAFILITGGKIVWPSNINWLYMNGDMATGLFAWEFFRHTPIIQSPLGANYPYGMGIGGSIVYAEQLFLFAFLFKLFSKVLLTPFQYEGLWILLCFILQSVFAWKLLEKITNVFLLKLLGCVFFILAPPFLWRLHGVSSYLGQWLILAAILLYLSESFHKYLWLIVLTISCLVHPYLLFMVTVLWTADLVQRKYLNGISYQKIIKHIILTSFIILLVLWQAGYFMMHDGYESSGFGFFRMNLLSFFDPTDGIFKSWSYVLPNLPRTGGDYEGFSYLGLGVIILLISGLFKLITQPQIYDSILKLKKNRPLIIASFLLLIYALSNRIVCGRYELIHYKLPEVVNLFRASGRMALPMFYLIYLGALNLIIKGYKKRIAIILIFICLIIQISDSLNIYKQFRHFFNDAPSYISGLNSPIWKEAAKNYKKLIYVLPEIYVPEEALVNYAAFNNIMINIGFFARHDMRKFNANKNKVLNSLLKGKLDKNAFYIIKNENLRRMIVFTKMDLPYKVINVDGYYLLLPNWKKESTEIERLNWSGSANAYKLGTLVSFLASTDNLKENVTLVDGWSGQEVNGTWTYGDRSILFFRLSEKPHSNLVLTLDSLPFINHKHPKLVVDILVNHNQVGHLIYKLNKYSRINQIEIPLKTIGVNNLLEIEFLFKYSVSPFKLGLNDDFRKLGLFILSMSLTGKN